MVVHTFPVPHIPVADAASSMHRQRCEKDAARAAGSMGAAIAAAAESPAYPVDPPQVVPSLQQQRGRGRRGTKRVSEGESVEQGLIKALG